MSGHEVPTPAADFDWQWNQLLDFIEAGLVAPVVGRELLWTEIEGARQYVPAYLARKFCGRAGLAWHDDFARDPDPLGTVVQRFLSTNAKGRNWPYTYISQLINELASAPTPPALRQLAQIPFSLFVSTVPDSSLERALNDVRFGGRPETEVVAFGLASRADLPVRHADTTVFPLLGRASPSPDYALTDEDVLEFVHRFQSTGEPRRLFDTLRQRHVLLIGSGFSDWLVRFLVRQMRPDRLWTSTTSRLTHFIADECVNGDARLAAFLRHPLTDAEVFPVTHAEQFVAELHARWKARHPHAAPAPVRTEVPEPQSSTVVEAGGVFLSYASDDYEAAARIRDALDRAGLDVWFDKRDLEAGDDFERVIESQIAKSYLFVAVVSRHSLTPQPRFFRLEWRRAEKRASYAAFDLPYVLPVAIDDTSERDERLPEFLRKTQWTRAPLGELPDTFITTVVQAYQKVQRPAASSAGITR